MGRAAPTVPPCLGTTTLTYQPRRQSDVTLISPAAPDHNGQDITRVGQQLCTLAAVAHARRPWNQYLEYPTYSRAVRAETSTAHQNSSADLLLLARELTLDAAQAARNTRVTTRSLPTAQLKKLLDSRNDREILEGLRRVIAVCLSAHTNYISSSISAPYRHY
ncbi:hypothetical protein RRF57_010133 [Xylaria bambusicola]|uniref:Uncharacterized protein n=1 Tax=Xylaria bambusicola TaxID=326684 RepID=A0AAN7UKR7_9PEZI